VEGQRELGRVSSARLGAACCQLRGLGSGRKRLRPLRRLRASASMLAGANEQWSIGEQPREVRGEAGVGFRVSNEQGPPAVGHHHQSAGRAACMPGQRWTRLGVRWRSGLGMGCVEPRDASSLQAIMLSICLQSMVDELMVKKSGGSIRKVRVGAGCCLCGGIPSAPVTAWGLGWALLALLGMGPAEGPPGAILTSGAARGDPAAEPNYSAADVSPASERGPAALGQPASCEIPPAAGEWDTAALVVETSVTMGFTVCRVPEPLPPEVPPSPWQGWQQGGLGQAPGTAGPWCPTPIALGREKGSRTHPWEPDTLGEGWDGALASSPEGG